MRGKIVSGSSVQLWAMSCWEVVVTLRHTTDLNSSADQVRMATLFPNGSGLFQQDNAPCCTAQISSK